MSGPRLAIDLGDTGVAGAVDPGTGAETTDLELDLAAVFAPSDDAGLVTGGEARRRAAADPARYEPAPRRHVDEGTLLLGTRVVGVPEALGAVLTAAVDRARPALRGVRPELLVLTHPASWGTTRRRTLHRAGAGLAGELVLVAEPVAAAAHAEWMSSGRRGGAVAVLDVGARGASAAVVDAGTVLAERSSDRFGGDHADELLLAHLVAGLPAAAPGSDRLRAVVAGADLPERRHRQVLVDDVRDARERLSDAEQAEVPLPGAAGTAWCARGELEDVLREPCEGLVDLLARVVEDAGVDAAGLAGVRILGGLARTPLLSTLVHRELGVPPVVPEEPRSVVARGALLAVARAPGRRAGPPSGPGPTAPSGTRPASPGPGQGPRTGSAGPGSAGDPPGASSGAVPPLLPDWPTARPAPAPGAAAGARSARQAAGPPGPSVTAPPARPDRDGPTVRIAHPLLPARRDPGRETPSGVAGWSPRRRAALVAAATVAVVVVVLAVAGVRTGSGGPSAGATSPTVVSVFDHAYELPVGWVTDGADAATRRSRIRPAGQPTGANLIAVQESRLPSADPASARAQLLAGFESTRAAGGAVSDLRPETTFGGRDVATYRQVPSPGTAVEWVVVFIGTTQLSVGCRHDDPSGDAVLAACARVVSTLRSPP